MTNLKESHKSISLVLLMLPMWINLVLRTQALQKLFMDNGFINRFLDLFNISPVKIYGTPVAVVLGLIYNYLPFMVLPIFTALEKMDKQVFEAARDLGANGFQVFRRVTLPLSISGIFSGIIMVFIPCLSTFVISEKMGAGKVYLIGNVINDMFNLVTNQLENLNDVKDVDCDQQHPVRSAVACNLRQHVHPLLGLRRRGKV
jgi:spermidine/putrescine transport system permease protein